ncbi:MAG: TolC family protein [Muribaculaceae bacterium]
MNKKIIFTALQLCWILCGCGIYGSYQRSENLPIDSLYRDADSLAVDSTSLSSLSWRELFTDSILVDWIERGLSNNTDLKVAYLKTEEAEASLKASKLAFLPSLDFSGKGALSSFDASSPDKTFSLGLSSEWEIDLFGRLRNASRKASATLAQSEAYCQAVKTMLIATIADNYYTLLMLDRQCEITRETLSTWSKTIEMMQALKRAGETNSLAISQANANYMSAKQSLISLEMQVHTLENTFSTLIGISPQPIKRGEFSTLSLPDEWSIGLPLEMVNKRPDVLQAERNLAVAFYATNEARSNFYPRVTLSGSIGWTNESGSVIDNPAGWLLNAIANVVQPLFNRGKNIANLKITKLQQEEALLAYRQKILEAGAEVNNSLIKWQTSQKSHELSRLKVEELLRAVHSAQMLMLHSDYNYLEVLTAQQSLLSAQLQEASDAYNEIQSIITLYHALGGGTE